MPAGSASGEPLHWITHKWDLMVSIYDIDMYLSFLITLLLCEFCYYWTHNFSHRFPLLWKPHQIHHGSERVYSGNSGRFHLLDAALGGIAYFLPIVLLDPTGEVIVLVISFSAVTGFMEHVNIDFKGGVLNKVLIQPNCIGD